VSIYRNCGLHGNDEFQLSAELSPTIDYKMIIMMMTKKTTYDNDNDYEL